jgi:hypothetical protein
VERISRFPKPAWHDKEDFASTHGNVADVQSASCAICHARESCERCHANADRVSLIAGLSRDRRIASLSGHARCGAPIAAGEDWREGTHAARHHRILRELPHAPSQTNAMPEEAARQDAMLTLPGPACAGLGVSPSRVTGRPSADFPARHGPGCRGGMNCARCHAEKICADCHAAPESRGSMAIS